MPTNFKRTFGNATSPLALSYLDDNFSQLEASGTSTVTLSGAQLIGYIQSGSGAVSRTVQAKERDIVSVKDFGAAGDGSNDDTAEIQAAIDSLTTGGVCYFPIGTYKTTSPITIDTNGTYLVGAGFGGRGVKMQFAPTAAGAVFHFDDGTNILSYVGIEGFEFASSDTTYKKTCIQFDNCGNFFARNIIAGSSGTTWGGQSSQGILIRGRETGTIDKVELYCDAPIVFEANPDVSTQQGDHITFRDTYLVAPVAGTSPCVGAASGAILSNINFEGYNAWVGGSGGFKWVDTGISAAAQNFSFKNIRWEQSTVSTAYIIELTSSAQAIYNVTLENVYGGSGTNHKGFKFRNTNRVVISNSWYTGTAEAINCDSTVTSLIFLGFFAQSGSTATLTDLSKVFGSPLDPSNTLIAPVAIYEPTTNTNPTVIGQNGQETTWTATLTGATTSPTGTVSTVRIGKLVSHTIPPFGPVTSNATTKSLTGMPADLVPSAQRRGFFIATVDNGGAFVTGNAIVELTGVINLYPDVALSAWTASGSMESRGAQLTYIV